MGFPFYHLPILFRRNARIFLNISISPLQQNYLDVQDRLLLTITFSSLTFYPSEHFKNAKNRSTLRYIHHCATENHLIRQNKESKCALTWKISLKGKMIQSRVIKFHQFTTKFTKRPNSGCESMHSFCLICEYKKKLSFPISKMHHSSTHRQRETWKLLLPSTTYLLICCFNNSSFD